MLTGELSRPRSAPFGSGRFSIFTMSKNPRLQTAVLALPKQETFHREILGYAVENLVRLIEPKGSATPDLPVPVARVGDGSAFAASFLLYDPQTKARQHRKSEKRSNYNHKGYYMPCETMLHKALQQLVTRTVTKLFSSTAKKKVRHTGRISSLHPHSTL